MKEVLRRCLERLPAPLPLLTQDAYRHVRYSKIRRERRLRRRILKKTRWSGSVVQGPFQGMRYFPRSCGSTILPKLLGTYECEIAPAVEAIAASGCDRVVDVGAAEGYYAVGLALRIPGVPLIGFEMDASARYYLRRLVRLNGVEDRVEIRGECGLEELAESLEGAARPVVVCDCEGAEGVLLDPDRVPGLRRAWLLVETHDDIVPGVSARVKSRFAATHDVETVRSRPRGPADLPPGCDLTPEEVVEATDEYRSRAEWLFLKPKGDEAEGRPAPENAA